jgi:hypothetical protein
MLTGMSLRMEHMELCKRRDFLAERIKVEGFTEEIMNKIMRLNADVEDLSKRTNEEMVRLGIQ